MSALAPLAKLPIHEQLPPAPLLSNPFQPTSADLVAQAAHMMALANDCDVTAQPNQRANPYATIGALRSQTRFMHAWLAARLHEEEQNLLMVDRLRAEAAQECAHEKLMAEDSDYAAEWDELQGGE